ncbi:unnamed protein product [Peniophora sp. CBMAI 1063]|nr:unnamed protein product [Peniophora sp. CBMAI 1063]
MSSDRMSSGQQTLDILFDMSQLLGTQLDKETLATCVGMIESGVNPEALAAVILELRREAQAHPPPSATSTTTPTDGRASRQSASRPPTRTGSRR